MLYEDYEERLYLGHKDLARKLMRYIRLYNKAPKPVKWTYCNVRHRISPESVVKDH